MTDKPGSRHTPTPPPSAGPSTAIAGLAVAGALLLGGLWWTRAPGNDATETEPPEVALGREQPASSAGAKPSDSASGPESLKREKSSAREERFGSRIGGNPAKPSSNSAAYGPPGDGHDTETIARSATGQRDGDARIEPLVDGLRENSPRERRPSQGTSPGGAGDDIGTLVAEVTPPADGSGDAVISLFSGKNESDTGTGAATDRNVERDSDGARFGPGSEFAVPAAGAINGESGSVSFWVRPDESADESSRASLLQLRSHYVFENRLQLWQTGAGLNLVLANDAGQETGIVVKSGGWEPGEWRHISVVWGDNQSEVYVNGTLAGTTEYEGKLQILPETLLHVGSNYPEDPGGITGTVNRFNVYDRAITPEEVAGLASQVPR